MFKKIMGNVRRWLSMIFANNKTIKEITQTQVSEDTYKLIEIWKAVYSGYYEEWHKMKTFTINKGKHTRRRHSLNLAKVSVEELSKLIFTEKVEINIDDNAANELANDILRDNRFYKVFQGKVEKMLALGGLVLKAVPKKKEDGTFKINIAYVTPDCFIPISWENESITEGVFLTVTIKRDKSYCLFEYHKWEYASDEAGNKVKVLVITNELYEGDKTGTEYKKVPLSTLYHDLEREVRIEDLTGPIFQYIKPGIENNLDIHSPLGISIFANALDTLYAIDVAFDSFIREFRLGKRRIIVPSESIREVPDPSNPGNILRYFDADDEAYEAFKYADPERQKIIDNTVELRVGEHVDALKALLDILAMQLGFSAGTFTFDGKGIKTATEVISENSKTYQTVTSHINSIEEGLIAFIRTLLEMAELYDIESLDVDFEEVEIDLQWDDSVIGDKYTDTDYYTKLNQNGFVSKRFVMKKVLGFTDEQIDEMLKEIKEENKSVTPSMDDLLGGSDLSNEQSNNEDSNDEEVDEEQNEN